ncbi:MAG: dihydrolipoyl dehydrogenase [Myxococcota bacterium]
MRTMNVDIAIIGAGTAGLNARREAEKAGKSWVLIESGPYGTTCARVGCMPSKLLISAADAAHAAHHSDRFGVNVEGVKVDGRAVMDRVRSERDRFAGFVVEATEALPEERRVHGRARFTGPTTLVVDDHTTVHAKAIVVATGSSPWVPPPFDGLKKRVLINDDVFEWAELPKSIAVVGTGIIGLELGQALHRLGIEVTFFNPFTNLGPFSDPEVKRVVHDVWSQELDLQLGVKDVEAEEDDDAVTMRWTTPEGERKTGRFEWVLAAAGRRPNLPDLSATGLELDERGRPKWDPLTTQAGDLPIFIAGDVSGHRPLLHEASDEGRIAGANAVRFPDVVAHQRRASIAVAFTEPQIALVGDRYVDIDDEHRVIGEVSFANQGRSRVMGVNQGILRLYADRRTCRLVGAEMFGPRAEHIAHLLAWSVQRGEQVETLLDMPFYHPVIEEGLRTALRDLAKNLRLLGGCRSEAHAEAPGD